MPRNHFAGLSAVRSVSAQASLRRAREVTALERAAILGANEMNQSIMISRAGPLRLRDILRILRWTREELEWAICTEGFPAPTSGSVKDSTAKWNGSAVADWNLRRIGRVK
jgi:hypothetical protein